MKSHTTILSIVFGFLIINLFLDSSTLTYILIAIAGLSLIFENISNFIEMLWNKLALILSYITPNILLTTVFYLLLTPLSILAKVFKAHTDYELVDGNSKSNYKEVPAKKFTKEYFERAW